MRARKIPREEYGNIIAMYKSGKTYQYIADLYGVTKQAIGKIAANHGITKVDGGRHSLTQKRRQERIEQRDKLCIEKHGYTYDEYKKITTAHSQPPAIAFRSQRNAAKNRGIEWNLSFREWWTIWEESGQWENRGREYGNYCMARFGDTGPYEADNVEIVTVTQNIREVRLRESLAKQCEAENCEGK